MTQSQETQSKETQSRDDRSPQAYSQRAVCRFTVGSWSESVFADIDGEGTTMGETYYPKRGLTRADVTYIYTGDIEGTGSVAYLISYMPAPAPVVGFERFEGSIGGHDGSCVLRHIGDQDAGSVTARLEVVPGLGTGGLTALRGEAELRISGHAENGYELVLDYDLD
ncbi:DUF3224 domain-containing protein [Glaciibacter superstes]|uniref:DUF3224 domain-containing protein n=1 Tax=Glaciibacter superstes TaxID=501023 RepID=UPI0003B35A8E|nr:DUF3224 domain-containing protein [Glaciibacter superstes]